MRLRWSSRSRSFSSRIASLRPSSCALTSSSHRFSSTISRSFCATSASRRRTSSSCSCSSRCFSARCRFSSLAMSGSRDLRVSSLIFLVCSSCHAVRLRFSRFAHCAFWELPIATCRSSISRTLVSCFSSSALRSWDRADTLALRVSLSLSSELMNCRLRAAWASNSSFWWLRSCCSCWTRSESLAFASLSFRFKAADFDSCCCSCSRSC
mmetsp:Transcript_54825/g.90407  ORF Transcript_54825/g.90407 Transcript_54825/m.90407 type:complete len:210 (-) Transcript_54825:264-893(-)